jgi:hypothetical protein
LTKSSKEASSLYGSLGLDINNEERGLGVGHVDKLPWSHEGFVRSPISLNSFKGPVILEIEKTMQGTQRGNRGEVGCEKNGVEQKVV